MTDLRLVASTAITPALWGTTYYVTTQLLPAGRPVLAGTVRALPAGILLVAVVAVAAGRRAIPDRVWWFRAALLGAFNVGVFFALLFVAAERLPGGIAAIPGALAPFLVAGLAVPVLGERASSRVLVAAAFGVAGVALLVLRSRVALDPVGLAAAVGGTVSLSLGTVFGRRFGLPGGFGSPVVSLLALTGWQLVAGGLFLAVLSAAVEGVPPVPSGGNLAGFAYLTLIGTALAYTLWFRGVTRLAAARVTLLALLSPVVAATIGWVALGESLAPVQLLGAATVVASVALGVSAAPAAGRG
jgi:probable blue pigment (indigoidine) exporter